MSADPHPCGEEYERPGGRQPGDRIVCCDLPDGHPDEHEETETGFTWWGKWKPGRGWERIRKEMPGIVPDITEEDERRVDELLAAAGQGRTINRELTDRLDYTEADVERLAEVIHDARDRGIWHGNYTLARWILDHWRPGGTT